MPIDPICSLSASRLIFIKHCNLKILKMHFGNIFILTQKKMMMKNRYGTSELIENLIVATYGNHANATEKRVFREALRGLVRLSKSEQMLELKTNISKMSGGAVTSRAQLPGANKKGCAELGQLQYEFPQFH